jgi:hypothetical protein
MLVALCGIMLAAAHGTGSWSTWSTPSTPDPSSNSPPQTDTVTTTTTSTILVPTAITCTEGNCTTVVVDVNSTVTVNYTRTSTTTVPNTVLTTTMSVGTTPTTSVISLFNGDDMIYVVANPNTTGCTCDCSWCGKRL